MVMRIKERELSTLGKTRKLALFFITMIIFFGPSSFRAFATTGQTKIPAKVYELDKDSHYVFDETTPSTSSAIGTLSIEGSVSAVGDVNTFSAYKISNGNASFTYKVQQEVLNRTSEEWHLVDDKIKKVNGSTLGSKIKSGALILQTSLDGITWSEDVHKVDIFAVDQDISNFYETKDVQLQNGCYYRAIIAYKMERQLEDSKILFLRTNNYEYKQVVEVYEFYAFSETDEISPDATPMKKFNSKINTGKDNGYSGNEPIDKDDPHYGWDLGYFYINGYTRETMTTDKVPVFLKNVGDKVTLWFHLSEDITKLRGNKNLTISEDTNGYDRTFEINQTNFKRGTLIIQYTNSQGEVQDPIIYTDYLVANARTGANTKVQLFEEGDYIVSLDYEIKSMVGPLNKIANYTNYKVMFEFSIRNGNCMVYPFDSLTGTELADNALTENGFKLDMAKSKYLTIDVKRSVLVVGTDGYLAEDVRFNRPAKDGEVYTSKGIYTFDVSNLYTNQHTTKTIYVGTDSYLRSLSTSGMSIAELNAEIKKAATVHEDDAIEVISTSVETPPEKIQRVSEPDSTPSLLEYNQDTVLEETQDIDNSSDTTEEPQKMNAKQFVIAGVVLVIIFSTMVALKRKKNEVIE